jgi:hypothetical protein
VALPTATQSDVSGLKDLVGVAGGTVGGTVRIGDQLVDAGDKQLVDELGTQLERHVFVTGGVASSLGKGLTASSLGSC